MEKNGVSVVSSVFTIPLGQAAAAKPAGRRAPRDTSPLLHDYFGDGDNSLVRVLVASFLSEFRYNPLVLVGPSAVGKSFLASGLANRWTEEHPDEPALLVTGSEFSQQYADALETDSLGEFRQRYLRSGAVVLDRLEQLVEKSSAQLELARLLDRLVDGERRVLVTCRGEPDFPQFHPALASRLYAGLVAPLAPPGDDARQRILAELLRRQRVRFDPAVVDLLSSHAALEPTQRPTVPQLARLVHRLATDSGPQATPWSAETLREYLAAQSRPADVQLRDIVRVVGEHFGVTLAELKGPSRRRQVVRARGLAVYLARQWTAESLESLGKFFGGRDHTTTLHACRSTERLLAGDAMLQQAAAAITHRIQDRTQSPS